MIEYFLNCIFDCFAFIGHIIEKQNIYSEYNKILLGLGYFVLCNLYFIVSTININMLKSFI